jgi:hypothetical protein
VKFQFGPDDKLHALPIAIGRLERLAVSAKKVEHGKREEHEEEEREEERKAERVVTTTAGSGSADLGAGHRIARAAKAGEHLGEGEFAFTTYALAAQGGLLLAPTTFACWGPCQTIPASVGHGSSTYTFVGGVVFRNF